MNIKSEVVVLNGIELNQDGIFYSLTTSG